MCCVVRCTVISIFGARSLGFPSVGAIEISNSAPLHDRQGRHGLQPPGKIAAPLAQHGKDALPCEAPLQPSHGFAICRS